MIGLILP